MMSTRVHGIMDYVMGVVLIAAPWLLGFAHGGAETWVPVIIGAGVILMSLLTRYEAGLAPVIPTSVHLMIDGVAGFVLAASPWLFGFAHIVWVPHLIFGLLEMGAAAVTERYSSVEAPETGARAV